MPTTTLSIALLFGGNAFAADASSNTELNSALGNLNAGGIINVTNNISGSSAFAFEKSSGNPAVTGDIVITGNGYTISNSGATNRNFYIGADSGAWTAGLFQDIKVSNLTFSNAGFAPTGGTADVNIYGGNRFGGLADGKKITLDNVTFKDNTITGTTNTESAGGAGLFAVGNGTAGTSAGPNGTNVNLVLDGVDFTDNKIEGSSKNGADNGAFGAGLNASFFNNVTITGKADGSTVVKDNEIGSSHTNGFGAGLYFLANENVTITDVSFDGNKNEATSGSYGGAIAVHGFGTVNLTIAAKNADVKFEGNTATTGKSIYSVGNVTFDAAAGKSITDSDGFEIVKDVTKTGAGDLYIAGDSKANSLTIKEGLVGIGGNAVLTATNGVHVGSNTLGFGQGGGTVTGDIFVNGGTIGVQEDSGTVGDINAGAQGVTVFVAENATLNADSIVGAPVGSAGDHTATNVVMTGKGELIVDKIDTSEYKGNARSALAGSFTAAGGKTTVSNSGGLANVKNVIVKDGATVNYQGGDINNISVSKDGFFGAASLDVTAGSVVESGINSTGSTNFGVTNDLTFGAGAKWVIDLNGVQSQDITISTSSSDLTDDGVQEALNAGRTLAQLTATNDGKVKIGANLQYAENTSDIYASAAYLHKWNTIYSASNGRIDSYFRNLSAASRSANYGVLGQAPCDPCEPVSCDPCEPVCGVGISGRSAWINYVGRYNEFGSSNALFGENIKATSAGAQFGVDFLTSKKGVLGAMFGYEGHRSHVAQDRVKGEDYYFGLYGARQIRNGFDVRGYFGYGHQNYDVSTYRPTSGGRLYTTSPDGDTVELTAELGKRVHLSRSLSYRPFLGLDWYDNRIDGSQEVGGYTYGKVHLDQLYLRFGSDVQLTKGRWNLNGSASYAANVLDDFATAGISIAGTPVASTLRTAKYGNSVFTFGTGVNYLLNPRGWVVFSNYTANVFADGTADMAHTWTVGTSWKF